MSGRNNSFLYGLIGRLARGAVPVDGVLWFEPQPLPERREATAAHLHDQIDDCNDCPAPIL